jgi:hypothetical protein
MDGPTEISQTTSVSRYRTRSTQTWQGPTQHTRLQKLPPLVVPEELPETTMRRIFKEGEYEALVSYLIAYQRAGDMRRWDEFRHKVPDDLLEALRTVMVECKRNGFIHPQAFDGKIVWSQILDNGSGPRRNADRCTLCERDCIRREMLETGEIKRRKILNPGYREPKPCWERTDETPAH